MFEKQARAAGIFIFDSHLRAAAVLYSMVANVPAHPLPPPRIDSDGPSSDDDEEADT